MSEFALGDYIFTRKRIGKGAFSTIYKGKHKDTGKYYAIKEISFENLEKIRDSIKREFTLMKNLNHKNIIKLHEVFFDNDEKNIYLVIDYFPKGDFAKFLNGKALKEKYAKKYMRQLVEGLRYLYNKQILHRDLKPQNILVSETGNLVITDFGFARYTDNEHMLNTLCGSPMYMAPEIMLKKRYNNKSDLWSVGVIFYEVLFGTTPYKAKNMIDLMTAIKRKPVSLPKNTLTVACRDLLLNLLRRDPDKRISWDSLFNHDWFNTDEILEAENALMDISFSKPLPVLDSKRLSGSNQFKSTQLFKHKSIRESCENIASRTGVNTSNSSANNDELQFNLSINESVTSSNENEKTNNIQIKIEEQQANYDDLEDINDATDYETSDEKINESSSDEEYEDAIDDEDVFAGIKRHPISKPIDIGNRCGPELGNGGRNRRGGVSGNSAVESSMFQSGRNGYHMISSNEYKYMSEPQGFNYEIKNNYSGTSLGEENSLKDSLKNVLSNSFHFLRMSINYLASKTI